MYIRYGHYQFDFPFISALSRFLTNVLPSCFFLNMGCGYIFRSTDASYKADEIHAALQRLEENRIRVENPSSPSHVNTTASRMV